MVDEYQYCQRFLWLCALVPLLFGCAVPRVVKYERPYPPKPSVVQHTDGCSITFPATHKKGQIIIYPLPDLEPVTISRVGVVLSGKCPSKMRAAYLHENRLGEISPTYQLSPSASR